MPEEEYSSVTVYPKPGMCIKTKNDKGAKFFLNLCRVDEIPAPTPMKGYYFGPRFFFRVPFNFKNMRGERKSSHNKDKD